VASKRSSMPFTRSAIRPERHEGTAPTTTIDRGRHQLRLRRHGTDAEQ
jgi:hypothetical protein